MQQPMVRRVGIFGGTFDPPHFGHLVAASEAAVRCRLDEIVFVPTGDPWQKQDRDVTDAAHRLAMTRLAVGPDPRFRVSTCDIERAGATYALDTVADVSAEYDEAIAPYFVFGADSLENLHTWHRVDELCRAVAFIALNRPGHSRGAVAPPAGAAVEFVDMPGVDISSSACRRRRRAGEPLRYLVPDQVAEYIADRGLYRS